jgi:lipid-A-disaccharide synthase
MVPDPPATGVRGPATVMIVAGEASGDLHGAGLCRALRALAPACRLIGMGGVRMAAAGLDVIADVTSAAAVGHTEAMGKLPILFRAYRRLRARLEGPDRPDALVLIDFPEFNLRLARAARRAEVPVIYYIPPQIWAWRAGRLHTIRQRVDLVLAVLPFEPALYRRGGVPVDFVGHPVVDALVGAPSRNDARARLGLGDDDLVIGLLPGSRATEVERHLPAMREATEHIVAVHPRARFLLARAPTVDATIVRDHAGPSVQIVEEGTHTVVRSADVLLATSGTVTLEAALLGTPMVVCYRLSWLSEALTRLLIRVPWISLANLTLGRGVIPELYREGTTGEGLAREALRLLDDPGARGAQREAFTELSGLLGEPGVSTRAARRVLALVAR